MEPGPPDEQEWPTGFSRRCLLVAIPAFGISGCLSGVDHPRGTETPDSPGPSDTRTGTKRPGHELNRLPEPSPLAEPLRGLVAARDRGAYASEHDLDYRNERVKVAIELTDDGELPEQYVSSVVGRQGQLVVANVEVDDLVDLALHEDVRIVRRPPDSRTHDA